MKLSKQDIICILEDIKNDNPYNVVEEYLYMSTYRKTIDKVIDKINEIM